MVSDKFKVSDIIKVNIRYSRIRLRSAVTIVCKIDFTNNLPSNQDEYGKVNILKPNLRSR